MERGWVLARRIDEDWVSRHQGGVGIRPGFCCTVERNPTPRMHAARSRRKAAASALAAQLDETCASIIKPVYNSWVSPR